MQGCPETLTLFTVLNVDRSFPMLQCFGYLLAFCMVSYDWFNNQSNMNSPHDVVMRASKWWMIGTQWWGSSWIITSKCPVHMAHLLNEKQKTWKCLFRTDPSDCRCQLKSEWELLCPYRVYMGIGSFIEMLAQQETKLSQWEELPQAEKLQFQATYFLSRKVGQCMRVNDSIKTF